MNYFKSVIAVLIVLVLTACGSPAEADYETALFDTNRVHTIDVRLAESDWQDLLTFPEGKTKYDAVIVIDGETVEQVSFAAKGNSSLAVVKYSGCSTCYSFKVNFGKGIKGQTFHGLDKLNLQNCFGDASYMKECLSENTVPSHETLPDLDLAA